MILCATGRYKVCLKCVCTLVITYQNSEKIISKADKFGTEDNHPSLRLTQGEILRVL